MVMMTMMMSTTMTMMMRRRRRRRCLGLRFGSLPYSVGWWEYSFKKLINGTQPSYVVAEADYSPSMILSQFIS